jgi:T4 RnlA family RNA ligase
LIEKVKDKMLEILNKYYEDGWLIKQTHPTLPLTIWNYSQNTQYESKWDEITLQCRGLVTDTDGNVIARPFKKFFNMEEGKHTPTSEFDVYEKMDGSLIIVFWYEGGWVVASRGSFSSDQAVAASKIFFDKLDHNFSIGITYLFEFTANWNRIVVDYGDVDNLTLLGAIRTDDETEATYEQLEMIASGANCDVVKRYDGIKDYSTLKGIIKDNQEGFVIRFSNGDRMKIKGDEYVRLHRIMTEVSTKSVWEVLSNGDNMEGLLKDVPDEFYDKIKEYETELRTNYNKIETICINRFNELKHLQKKEYAEEVKWHKYSSVLFSMYNGKPIPPTIWKLIKPEFKKL